MAEPLTAAVLIVSTTAALDPSTDAAAAVLREVFNVDGAGKWAVTDEKIVSDNVIDIQKQIMQWTDRPDAPNFIITTGGTGFAVSDATPEVQAVMIFCMNFDVLISRDRQSPLYSTSKLPV
ncbi:Molybdenum cofactor synthesis protein cinnamon [Beauveria bassiana]|uniref:Molybdenum cofactor synthesis protein cinnamon n=1 Tax=Beauveria bassiana TaxID=176275 RepID=A0A2N6NUL4_BEABA|nr:Molybdenum cofactor synthesis protein cinnamon [Beauveria bassiana]